MCFILWNFNDNITVAEKRCEKMQQFPIDLFISYVIGHRLVLKGLPSLLFDWWRIWGDWVGDEMLTQLQGKYFDCYAANAFILSWVWYIKYIFSKLVQNLTDFKLLKIGYGIG